MNQGQKKPASPVLDFFLGFLGLVGLIIMAIRNSDNELKWGMFILGWVGTWVLISILFFAVCVIAIASTPTV